jgi:WS/DGAT/MGAT family acyltransferase
VKKSAAPSELALLVEALPNVLLRPLRVARTTGRTVFSMLRDRLTQEPAEPEPAPAPPVPPSLFNLRSSPHRSVATVSLPMQRVKAIGRAFDATVNDVILALVSGAARQYLSQRGALPTESLVAAIPASTHTEGDDLANAYTLLFPTLATQLTDPAARLRAIRDDSRHQKRGRPRGNSDLMLEWADIPAPWLFHVLARLYVQIHFIERIKPFFNILVSSVPGPPIPLYFAGARITGLHPLGPVYDGMLLNVTAIGREDSLDVGLLACRKGVPDLWEIAEGLVKALDELEACRQT